MDFPYVDRFSQFHSVYFYFHDPGGHVFCCGKLMLKDGKSGKLMKDPQSGEEDEPERA